MKTNSKGTSLRNYANRILGGVALSASLLGSGCASVQQIGSGLAETTDGLIRPVAGASSFGPHFYNSDNPDAPNYRPRESVSKDANSVVVQVTSRTVSAAKQVGSGSFKVGQGLVGIALSPFMGLFGSGEVYSGEEGQRYGVGEAVKDLISPYRREGLSSPTTASFIDALEKRGGVHVDSLEPVYRDSKLIGFWHKVAGFVPILNRANNDEGHNEAVRAVGDAVYGFGLFKAGEALSGGSSNTPRPTGIFGGNGQGGPGAK
jgi:hypothetical protein